MYYTEVLGSEDFRYEENPFNHPINMELICFHIFPPFFFFFERFCHNVVMVFTFPIMTAHFALPSFSFAHVQRSSLVPLMIFEWIKFVILLTWQSGELLDHTLLEFWNEVASLPQRLLLIQLFLSYPLLFYRSQPPGPPPPPALSSSREERLSVMCRVCKWHQCLPPFSCSISSSSWLLIRTAPLIAVTLQMQWRDACTHLFLLAANRMLLLLFTPDSAG